MTRAQHIIDCICFVTFAASMLAIYAMLSGA